MQPNNYIYVYARSMQQFPLANGCDSYVKYFNVLKQFSFILCFIFVNK